MKLPVLIALLLVPLTVLHAADVPAKRPNILWFVVYDMSANFSCYGEKTIQTPHVDRLAREGTRFTNAFVTAPVCSRVGRRSSRACTRPASGRITIAVVAAR